MANKIKITVDSTCDMTPELCRQYDVTKIPLSILLGAQAHDDGIDITPDDIYAYYERTGTTAKTAAVRRALISPSLRNIPKRAMK